MFLIAAIVLVIWSLTGCASQTNGLRSVHTVEKKQSFVAVQDQVIPVTETTETWTDDTSETKTTAGPDLKQIAPAVELFKNAAVTVATGGTNHLIEIGFGLLTATATAYAAKKHGEVNEKNKQIKYHQQDSDEGWSKAEAHALARTPPLQV